MRRRLIAGMAEVLFGIIVGFLTYRAVGDDDPSGATLGVFSAF